jgi:hypothetical protein
MNTIPWSEQSERRLILYRLFCWIAVACAAAIGFIFLAVKSKEWVLVPMGVFCIACGYVDGQLKIRQEKMQANKPFHGSAGLTRWHWHQHTAIAVTCQCGNVHTFEGKQFFARQDDPGGGRYSFVCGCGRGHYKFAANVK